MSMPGAEGGFSGTLLARREVEQEMLLEEMRELEFSGTLNARSEVKQEMLLAEMRELEHGHALELAGLESKLAQAAVQCIVTSCELAALESKAEGSDIALAVMTTSLLSMEENEGDDRRPVGGALPASAGAEQLAELRDAVVALEFLLDAELGAPQPPGPISSTPDQLCANLLEHALRLPVPHDGEHAQLVSPFACLEGQMLVARAVRALGRRASGIAATVHEFAILQAVLESEILQLESVETQGPALMNAGAAGG
ncbi:hypothetical protein T492DRAFT_1056189 [Pavlovales sp. CCMP2436]|nr:hypothetical protein T492DRAFT_1056189 [Pavlovales sp. CCMP2436]